MHREKINENKWLRNFSDLQEYLNAHQECSILDIPPDYRTKLQISEFFVIFLCVSQTSFFIYFKNFHKFDIFQSNNILLFQYSVVIFFTLPYRPVDKKCTIIASIISTNLQRSVFSIKFFQFLKAFKPQSVRNCAIFFNSDRFKEFSLLIRKCVIFTAAVIKFLLFVQPACKQNVEIPYKYVCEDGNKLGVWICTVRDRKATVSAEIIKELNKMKMIWNVPDMRWFTAFSDCERFYRKNGNLLIPATYPSHSGIDLRNWIAQNRQSYIKGKLSQEKINMLNRIGALNSLISD